VVFSFEAGKFYFSVFCALGAELDHYFFREELQAA
jgi:hypothetical protein